MSEIRANPFHTIRGWYWDDENDGSHGPYDTQRNALRALLKHLDRLDRMDRPPMIMRFLHWLGLV